MVRVGSIRVSGPLSGEHISGMVPGHSVRVSGLGSILPGLSLAYLRNTLSLVYLSVFMGTPSILPTLLKLSDP